MAPILSLDLSTSRTLVSHEMRQAVKEGLIKTPSIDLEGRIQPASFEPIIGDEVYVLDTENGGLFRPDSREQVYWTLLQLPERRRRKESIVNGFTLKTGFSYLFKLEEKFNLPEGVKVEATPKSTQGRMFNLNRLMADYNSSFDEVMPFQDKELELWLLSQPLAFDLIVHPGMTLNQLRFCVGNNYRLTDRELEEEYQKNQILRDVHKPLIQDGLRLSVDAIGMEGIVGFRARKNQKAIDLREKNKYSIEDYFEPITAKNNVISLKPSDCCLLFSKEWIMIPPHLNAKLKDRSQVGINGLVHFAGFFDPKFNGHCTYEIKSFEISPIALIDNMPLSELQFYRCNIPDKLYGAEAGSHYQDQEGPRVAKYFKGADFKELGKRYQKLNKDVLTLPTRELNSVQDKLGFEFATHEKANCLEKLVKNPMFHLRYDCETDEEVLQVIPYVLVLNKDKIFYYVRANKMEHYGDKRLNDKYSVGVGGHIHKEDALDYLVNCIKREVSEEVKFEKGYSEPILVGTLKARDEPVDRVHFGAIYAIQTDGDVFPAEKSIVESGFTPINTLMETYPRYNYETWSKILIPKLNEIKDYLNKPQTI